MPMTRQVKLLIFCAALSLSTAAFAQLPSNRVRPAVMYYAGDTVRSPRLGLQSRIPEGWSGVLPRDTEVFLLMPVTNIVGEIFVVMNENIDIDALSKRWKTGMELSPGLTLLPEGDIITRGEGTIAAVGKLGGSN